MNLKDKVVVNILVVVLVSSIFCLGVKKLNYKEDTAKEDTTSMEVIRVMSDMENRMLYEKKIASFAESNEILPVSLEQMFLAPSGEDAQDAVESNSSEVAGIEPNEKLPEYATLYPDMYVEKICPDCGVNEKKVAYLSFDDGPSKNTEKILQILREKDACATFFLIGSTIDDEGKESIKHIVEQGSKIGIHSYCHEHKAIYSSVKGFLDDFYKVYTQIYEITGQKPNIFRFPWGSYNSYSKPIKKNLISEMERRGFTYYDWNVSAEDSVGHPTQSSIMKNIMKDVKRYNQPVILMHDSRINDLTVQMLPTIIDKLKELGYTFDTLDHREPCQFHW